MNQAAPFKMFAVFLFAGSIACAVTPAPNGGYGGHNTASGTSALFSLTNGIDNAGLGFQALYRTTTGNYNTGTGFRALFNNTMGSQNTANGINSLAGNVTGNSNTAVGANALYRNQNGNSNTALGVQALFSNTTSNNTAVGYQALLSNTSGGTPSGSDQSELGPNTAIGSQALLNNTTGSSNTAIGFKALSSITTNGFSTAVGYQALTASSECCNTAFGYKALTNNISGAINTATGDLAMYNNTSGSSNVALGFGALMNNISANSCTAIGQTALVNATGDANIALGASAGSGITTGNHNIDVGNAGVAADSGVIRIGTSGVQTNCYIAGVFNSTEASTPVCVDSTGHLGVASSSRRFKKEIKPMDSVSESILSLKPVTFEYKDDRRATPQFGLIAEEVAKVNPDLIVRDNKGDIYTVRYDAVNAMLLNEFLKEHTKVEELQATIADLKSRVAQQEKGMETLAAQLNQQATLIQKVNVKLEARTAGIELARSKQ